MEVVGSNPATLTEHALRAWDKCNGTRLRRGTRCARDFAKGRGFAAGLALCARDFAKGLGSAEGLALRARDFAKERFAELGSHL